MATYIPRDPMDRDPQAQRLLAKLAGLDNALRHATGQRRIEALQEQTAVEDALERVAIVLANRKHAA